MVKKRSFHTARILTILFSGLLIIIAGLVFWKHYKYKLVNKTIDKLVSVKSKGLYKITYSHLVINEAVGNIEMEDIQLAPDSVVYRSMLKTHTAPDNLLYIKIPRLHISGVKTPKALLNKEISAHIIRIENAEIEVRLGKEAGDKDSINKIDRTKELYQQILGSLKSITADSVVMEGSSLIILDEQSKDFRCKLTGLNIRMAALAIDSLNHLDTTRIAFSRDVSIHCDYIEAPDKRRIYTLQLYGIEFNSTTGNFHISQIKYKQKLSEAAFAKSNIFAADRFDIEMGKLDIWHIDRQSLLRKELSADTLQLTNAFLRIFRDKSYPHDTVDRTHSYPQEAIMLLPLKIHLKKIVFKDSYIEYKEKNDKSDSTGTVAFFHVQAIVDNVTNMLNQISRNDKMVLDFNSSFLNQAPLHVTLTMHLNDRKGNFELVASMGSLSAIALNPLLKPMALAEFDKGDIMNLRYRLIANNTHGNGFLKLNYRDLSVKLLKKDADKNKYKTKLLPTLAAGFLLKDANPQKGKMRTGNVDYTRDIHRSIFNLMWKSLFAAVKQVAM